jgi:hypothetical protein
LMIFDPGLEPDINKYRAKLGAKTSQEWTPSIPDIHKYRAKMDTKMSEKTCFLTISLFLRRSKLPSKSRLLAWKMRPNFMSPWGTLLGRITIFCEQKISEKTCFLTIFEQIIKTIGRFWRQPKNIKNRSKMHQKSKKLISFAAVLKRFLYIFAIFMIIFQWFFMEICDFDDFCKGPVHDFS